MKQMDIDVDEKAPIQLKVKQYSISSAPRARHACACVYCKQQMVHKHWRRHINADCLSAKGAGWWDKPRSDWD